MTYDLRARPLLVILFLVVAAAAAGLLALERTRAGNSGETSATPATASKVQASPAKPKPAAAHRAAPAHRKPAAAKTPSASNQLPVAIRRALAADRVVVVALYDPKAKIDGTAVREARAGARLGDGAFVAVNVRKHGVDSLNARYGAVQDPGVLVLQPPGGALVVRIDGFADRDTVAQAAVNAAS